LPFSERQFDVAVALDVVEHMPGHLRAKAAAEMARVAGRLVVIACPPDEPWVHVAEDNANQIWRNYFGENYPWLDEHKEFGLVAGDEIERALIHSGFKVVRFGQGDTAIWSGLMAAHFVKEAVSEMRPLVAAADCLYNRSVFAGDRSGRCYREYFIGVRHQADLELVQRATVLNANADAEAAAFLSSLGGHLAPIASRILLAEKEWKSSVDSLRISEVKQQHISQAWQRTVDSLRESEDKRAEISAGWQQANQLLRDSEERQLRVSAEWGRTAELFRECEGQLVLARSEITSLTEKSNGEAIRIERLLSEKSQVEHQFSELGRRHELSLRDIRSLTIRVRQLERRQRWLGVGAVILVLVAAATYYFHPI